MPYLVEVCVDSETQALNAQAQGAQRIELCARLDLDGLTPSEAFIRFALTRLKIPVHVMIRPRGGDFVYTEEELEAMRRSIALCKALGAPGVVFGMLRPDDTLDMPRIAELSALARPMKVVIHKAIDRTPDPVAAVRQLLDADAADLILTSGGAPTAQAGAATIRAMQQAAGTRITIIAAGKVTQDNLEDMHALIGAREYHGRLIVGPLGSA